MSPILSLPVEVIVLVFQHSGGLTQVATLSSTCKLFHSVWLRNSPSILGHVPGRQIRAFDDALMAVRATQIVKDAIQAGQLPPDPFPTAGLSSSARPPSIDELKTIYDFQHLAKCIEHIFIKDVHESWFGSPSHFGESLDFSSDPPSWRHWRERFYSSIYRVFLAGALLYRAYQAPHALPADDRPSDFLKTATANLEEYRASEDGLPQETELTESDIRYLLKFPVFNFEAYEEHEPVFGQLAELLFNLSKDRVLRNDDIPAPKPVSKYHVGPRLPRRIEDDPVKCVLFSETMQLLLIIELLCGTSRPTCVFLDGLDANRDGMGDRLPYPHKLLEPTEPTRKVSVVLFDKFFLEEILMPRTIEDANVKLPVAIPVDNQLGFRDTGVLLYEMFHSSGQPNHYISGCEAAPPELQCVQYIFRRYFNLRFADKAFEVYAESPYRMLYSDGDLFLEDDIHSYVIPEDDPGGLLSSADKPHANLHYIGAR
ncbi:hypothetical protein AJ80_07435 [Polytolypa hystricis UAMH7299]|uniref:F-box domain-containing protein n=1 Tax=Polytolypa hystricis (strain UAMH7299) TaxID=1447883 RepID=A0A2B7XNX6_POLH7|nr:hypothetical protein AJ80_07435 [Polytolypa hystricis UAMH7299]